jgi:hypothetical protein
MIVPTALAALASNTAAQVAIPGLFDARILQIVKMG